MIKIDGLYHEYKKESGESIETLKNINIEIKKGNFVSIIGHNGSGKSTLAKHLNGLIVPQKGSITVEGMAVLDNENIWQVRQRVGMVFQNPDNQFVGGTIEEDIAFGLENLGIPSKDMMPIILAAAQKVGMEQHLKRPPHRLSGGQKQRSAIGSVLAMKPEYLVLDEPTSMLDPKGRKEVIEVLRQLNRDEAMTIVLITHFMDEVVYSDKVVVMDQGEVIIEGSPKAVFSEKKLLENIGMRLPKALEISLMLKEKGLELENTILTKEELVKRLCQLK
ncbi:energy-coupling factor transporter ATPase [endosymbiont 'TC1' of Trimyema compressum]|uniref:energy-coupling factor transporter ATPase n=1 Tax=endosymbiont 'TC1' of Trimyema compressum TaxID=243899 RepID=UPI0007F134AD|nr:energy-coupling factor transporter ATPase [endosymbiont 'TC1' of Trimyema compressum]AMP21355.1 energy-coupling factor transporter ATPase [endosymbiont 'TC1' of Trimyema compressum]